jgi:hypothetical protein
MTGVQALLPSGTKFINAGAASFMQNDNESVGLIRQVGVNCEVVDAVCYENEDGAITTIANCANATSLSFLEVSSAPGADSNTVDNSFARNNIGADSNVGASDWTLKATITRGVTNP